MQLSKEDADKLDAYVASLEQGDGKRERISKMIMEANPEKQMREDLEPLREDIQSGLKHLDSVTGAPTRKALSEMMAGDKPGSVKRIMDQFGDSDSAPSWEDLAGQAGVENETVKKGVGLIGPFLEPNIPFGGAFGMAKKVGREVKGAENVVDFAKKLAERGPKEMSAIDKLHGENGKILGSSEDYLSNEAPKQIQATKSLNDEVKRDKAMDIINRTGSTSDIPDDLMKALYRDRLVSGSINKIKDAINSGKEMGIKVEFDAGNHQFIVNGKRMEVPDTYDMLENKRAKADDGGLARRTRDVIKMPGSETKQNRLFDQNKPISRDEFMARFGDDGPITHAQMDKAESIQHPYVTAPQIGEDSVHMSLPNFEFKAGKEIGHRGIMHSINGRTDVAEPLPWMDSRYEITKNALKNAKGPVRINTSSDLIARDDYINTIPQGSTVHIYGLSPNEHLNRIAFPGNPSQKRLELAVQKLKSSGINVKLEMPTIDEYIERANAINARDVAERVKSGKNPYLNTEQRMGMTIDGMKEALKESGLRETKLEPIEGGKVDIDPFGQKAKSKLKRPKKPNEGDDV